MGTAILGWALIIIGMISTIAGITGAIVRMMKELIGKDKPKGMPPIPELPTDFVKALKELVEAFIQAPIWLALVMIGFVLIAWGGTFIK